MNADLWSLDEAIVREDLATPASWASPRSTRAAIEATPWQARNEPK